MKRTNVILKLGMLMLLASLSGFSQSRLDFYQLAEQWYLGARLSAVTMHGDFLENNTKIGSGIFLGKLITPEIGTNFSLNFGSMSGVRKFLEFETKYIDYALEIYVDMIKVITGNVENPFSANGIIGIGGVSYRGKTLNTNTNNYIEYYGYTKANGELKNTSMQRTIAFPFGISVGYMIIDKIGVDLSLKLFKISTDAFDSRDKKGTKNDTYSNISLNVKYKLPIKYTPSLE